MILMITPENKHHYEQELDDYYRLRHRIYNTWLGWDIPHIDGREIDEYDHEDTVSILSITPDGKVDAGVRMIPTLSHFMIADVFSDIWEGREIPSADGIWEFSRYVIDWDLHNRDRDAIRRVGAGIACAVMEYCLMNDVSELIAVLDTNWEPRVTGSFGDPIWKSNELVIGTTPSVGVHYRTPWQNLQMLRRKFTFGSPIVKQFAEAVNT